MMGGDGRGEASNRPARNDAFAGPPDSSPADDASSLFGAPGPELAAAVLAVADPARGSWPVGSLPVGASSEPWAQVVHAVVAARRLAGWALWAQLSMVARLVVAWQASPPVSDAIGVPDRCGQGEGAGPALAERLNDEVGRVQR